MGASFGKWPRITDDLVMDMVDERRRIEPEWIRSKLEIIWKDPTAAWRGLVLLYDLHRELGWDPYADIVEEVHEKHLQGWDPTGWRNPDEAANRLDGMYHCLIDAATPYYGEGDLYTIDEDDDTALAIVTPESMNAEKMEDLFQRFAIMLTEAVDGNVAKADYLSQTLHGRTIHWWACTGINGKSVVVDELVKADS